MPNIPPHTRVLWLEVWIMHVPICATIEQLLVELGWEGSNVINLVS